MARRYRVVILACRVVMAYCLLILVLAGAQLVGNGTVRPFLPPATAVTPEVPVIGGVVHTSTTTTTVPEVVPVSAPTTTTTQPVAVSEAPQPAEQLGVGVCKSVQLVLGHLPHHRLLPEC